MKVHDFARMTRRVIGREGLERFLPTAYYPTRHHLMALDCIPDEEDVESASLRWATRNAQGTEEFLIAFAVNPRQFKVIRCREGHTESVVFDLDGPR